MTGNIERIVLLGGGGHARVLIDLIRLSGKYEIAGILDTQIEKGTLILNVPVLGDDDLLAGLYKKGITNACIGIGSTRGNSRRGELYKKVKEEGLAVPYLVHQRSIVPESIKISEGVQIIAGVIIQTGSSIGKNTIINTGAIIEHDCIIGRNVHICPGVVICGSSTVGDNSFVGAGAIVKQEMKIGRGTTVGAGALVINDLPDGVTVKGVPAR